MPPWRRHVSPERHEGWGGCSRRPKDKCSGELRKAAIWWIEVPGRGKPHRESSGSRSVTDARKLLKHRLGQMAGGTFAGR
jgi:hypothetical protein